jgi:hypothetical protein
MKKTILLSFLILSCLNIYAQTKGKREVGLRIAYGIKNELLPEEKEYQPILILPYYQYYFTPIEKRFRVGAFVEGQIVPVLIDKKMESDKDAEWELGFNIGPAIYYRCWLIPYIGIAYGANYITVDTEKQADGIIFTATAFAGVKKEIRNNYYVDLHVRGRHISNGGLKSPNYGIDTIFGGLGFSKIF